MPQLVGCNKVGVKSNTISQIGPLQATQNKEVCGICMSSNTSNHFQTDLHHLSVFSKRFSNHSHN